MWQYKHTDELYHYGVLGMRWGQRRSSPKSKARAAYRQAKRDYRKAALKSFGNDLRGFGVKGIARAQQSGNAKNMANNRRINAKIKYKTAGMKNANKAAKKEYKIYKQEMWKSGLPGSAADRDNRSTSLYKSIKAKKGKAYADKVQKSVERKAVASIAGTATVALGLAVANRLAQERY